VNGSEKSLYELLLQGGWTMVPLLACSVASVAVLAQKGLQFTFEKVRSIKALELAAAYAKDGDLDELALHCSNAGTPLGDAMAMCANTLLQNPERAEDEVRRFASVELERLERWLPVLSFIAQAAPLFGLLGTVIGMVELFSSMEAAGAAVQTGMLSSGIWKALLTTAAGLVIAIPSLGGHVWLSREVDRLRVRMEDGAGQILTAFAAHHRKHASGGAE
jgi:biopolymer transport protein ExbB